MHTRALRVYRGPCGAQKRVLDFLELELKVIVSSLIWVLGTEFRSSAREREVLLMAKHLSSFFYLFSYLGSGDLNSVSSSHKPVPVEPSPISYLYF